MSFTVPRDAPVSLVESTSGRPVLRSIALGPVHRYVRLRREQLARGAVERVHEAVLVEVDQHLPQLAVERQLGEDHLLGRVVVPVVGRGELVGPAERAVARIACQHAGRPAVVARALLGVPGTGVAGAVVHQVEFGIVGKPSPHRRAAMLPSVGGPAREREFLVLLVERLERGRGRQHLGVRARCCTPSRRSRRSQGRAPLPIRARPSRRRRCRRCTRSFTTSGAIGVVSPRSRSAIFVFQSSRPLAVSTATVWPSSRLNTILPSAYAAPRFTMSQQAMPIACGST